MTLPLRRKRPITAPNTPPATRTSLPARLALAAAVAAGCWLGGPVTLTADAAEAAVAAASPSTLKWQPRGTAAQRAASEPTKTSATVSSVKQAQHQSPAGEALKFRDPALARPLAERSAEPAPVAKKAVAATPVASSPDEQVTTRRASPRAESARSRLRNMVMQVSTDRADAFQDPFQDDPATRDLPAPGTADLPAELAPNDLPPATTESRSRLRASDDPLPGDNPPPLGTTDPDTLPENRSVVEGLAPPEAGASCDDYKKECQQAIEVLRERDITKIIFGIVVEGEGGNPPVEGVDYPCQCMLGLNATFQDRNWSPTTFTWKASSLCHKPLYFEDVQLERYGHSWTPGLQPFMSAGHFFFSIPRLPYKMGLESPCECHYTLGYYRPGSCAPYMIEPIPFSLRGAVYETLAVTGFAFWFWPPPTGP
jgi:hypothetical protein